MFIFLLLVLIILFILTQRQKKRFKNAKRIDSESQSPSSADIASPPVHQNAEVATGAGSGGVGGTVKRTTGHPQTLAGWVRETNAPKTVDEHPRASILVHTTSPRCQQFPLPLPSNPAPPVSEPQPLLPLSASSSIYSQPPLLPPPTSAPEPQPFFSAAPSIYLQPQSLASHLPTLSRYARPGTRDSISGSSFRMAVLGVAEESQGQGKRDSDTDGINGMKGVDMPQTMMKKDVMFPDKVVRGYSGAWP